MVATAKRDFARLVSPGAPAGSAAATGSRRLLSVVLGADSENARANEFQKLLNWGYTAFEAVKLFDADQAVVSAKRLEGYVIDRQAGSPAGDRGQRPGKGLPARSRPRWCVRSPCWRLLRKEQAVATLRVTVGGAAPDGRALLALEARHGGRRNWPRVGCPASVDISDLRMPHCSFCGYLIYSQAFRKSPEGVCVFAAMRYAQPMRDSNVYHWCAGLAHLAATRHQGASPRFW